MKVLVSLFLVTSANAQSSLTLEINTTTKELSWLGTGTSYNSPIGNFTTEIFFLTTGTFNSPNPSPNSASIAITDSLEIAVDPAVQLLGGGIPGRVSVTAPGGTSAPDGFLSVFLENYFNFDSLLTSADFTVTVLDNGPFSYSDLDAPSQAFIAGLDGASLDARSNLGNVVPDVANISVISVPEPTSSLFLALGSLCLLRRKR